MERKRVFNCNRTHKNPYKSRLCEVWSSKLYQRFRVWCSIRKIMEVGILWAEVDGTFSFVQIRPLKAPRTRKCTICKGFWRFLFGRDFCRMRRKWREKQINDN